MSDLFLFVAVVLLVAAALDGLVWIYRRHRSDIRIWFGIDDDKQEDQGND